MAICLVTPCARAITFLLLCADLVELSLTKAVAADRIPGRYFEKKPKTNGHYHDKNNVHISHLLDVVRLSNLIYSGAYLTEVFCDVMDWYDITKAIISTTRDNAGTNDTMLYELEALVEERYAVM